MMPRPRRPTPRPPAEHETGIYLRLINLVGVTVPPIGLVVAICHLWGSRRYDSDDHSRNNFIFGVLALGEGWHNNNHAFPCSAKHGLRWWQFDAGNLIIRAVQRLGQRRAGPDPRKATDAAAAND